MLVSISFDIHCEKPNWAKNNSASIYLDTKYRLYVNDDLITERTWIWNNTTVLRENIWVESDSSQYLIKLEPIQKIPEQALYTIKNLIVNGWPKPVNSNTETSFTIL